MGKLKVGFDISQTAHFGGVANYTEHLASKLSELSSLEMIYFFSSLRKTYQGDLKNVKSFRLPPSIFEVLFNRVRSVNIEKFIGPIDIFHSSDWVQPKTKAKKVTTYHDLSPMIDPKWSTPKIVEVQKRRLRIVKEEVDKVIAVSRATKQDLIEIAGVPSDKIVVVYEAVDKVFKRQDQKKVDDFRKKYNLPEKIVLSISGVGERRNLRNIKKAARKYALIISGETIPYLPKEEMSLLYNCASVLLYPSFYEGFGLPILEAFKCGVPVITSNVSSMPEISGDGALLVDPNNPDEIEDKLNQLMEDKSLRQEMIKKGEIRSQMFSWEKVAQETCKVYKELIDS